MESQGTAARLRLCTGEPTGLGGVQRPCSPRACKGEASRGGGGRWGHRDGPHSVASLSCPGGKNYGVGGCSPRESQLPGTVRAAVQARPGSPRDPAPGVVVAAGGDAGCGCSSFSCGFRGGVGGRALSGGCRQPALVPLVRLPEGSVQLLQLGAERQADLQVHAEGLQPLLQLAEGRPEREGGTRGSSAVPVITTTTPPPTATPSWVPQGGVPTTHRFSGSRSQQHTAMGKKLGGQVGGQ